MISLNHDPIDPWIQDPKLPFSQEKSSIGPPPGGPPSVGQQLPSYPLVICYIAIENDHL